MKMIKTLVSLSIMGFSYVHVNAAQINANLNLTSGLASVGQQLIKAKKDDVIYLKVKSNESGELHLHAYQLEIKVSENEVKDVSFKAFATGRFTFEWHPNKVNNSKQMHHKEPLAMLEVFPQ